MSLTPDLQSGTYIQQYQLVRQLARGGMGAVWLARLRRPYDFSKLVALKVLLPQYASDEQFRLMFLDEARIASAITHPNVAPILDLGEHKGRLYLVMEWVDGQALHEVLKATKVRGQRTPPGVCAHLAAAACAGLHAAHELCDGRGQPLHVVHRDVSPQNIMVDARGHVKVIDFGVAKARNRLGQDTSTGHIKGRLSYMSPEQAGVLNAAIDRRADVWSLCAVLYYMLSGRRPIEADSDVAALGALLAGEVIPPLPADVPAPLARVVMGGLRHDPAARFATAEELRLALEGAAREAGVQVLGDEVATFISGLLGEKMTARRRADRAALAELDALHRCDPSPLGPPSPSGAVGANAPSARDEFEAGAPLVRAAAPDAAAVPATMTAQCEPLVAAPGLPTRLDGDEPGSLLGTSSGHLGDRPPKGERSKAGAGLALLVALTGFALLGVGTAKWRARGEARATPLALAPTADLAGRASPPPFGPALANVVSSSPEALAPRALASAAPPPSVSSAVVTRARPKLPPPPLLHSSRLAPARAEPSPAAPPPTAPTSGDVAGAIRDRH